MAASYSGPNAGDRAKRSSAECNPPHKTVGIWVLEMQELCPAFICMGREFLILICVAKYYMSTGSRGICKRRRRTAHGEKGQLLGVILSWAVSFLFHVLFVWGAIYVEQLQDLQQTTNTVKTLFSLFTAAITVHLNTSRMNWASVWRCGFELVTYMPGKPVPFSSRELSN